MKKFISLTMALMLCLTLCACSFGDNSTQSKLTKEELAYVGKWEYQGKNKDGNDYFHTLYLYDDGVALLDKMTYVGEYDGHFPMNNGKCCTWDIRDGYIMIYNYGGTVECCYQYTGYKILGDTLVDEYGTSREKILLRK